LPDDVIVQHPWLVLEEEVAILRIVLGEVEIVARERSNGIPARPT